MTLPFVKYSGCGNDFVLLDGRSQPKLTPHQIQRLCHRNHGVGADGVIYLNSSCAADVKMNIYNSDGSEAQMCGNGIRCLYLYARELGYPESLTIETLAGLYHARGKPEEHARPERWSVEIETKNPSFPIHSHTIDGMTCEFLFTGTQHAVCQVEDLKGYDVEGIGKKLRHHPVFNPTGTNVNFYRVEEADLIELRTYEKGVEGETLACGTGAVAAAYVHARQTLKNNTTRTVRVKTRSGEILSTRFDYEHEQLQAVHVTGPVCKIFEGKYYC